MYCMQCFLKSKYIKSRTFNDKNRWIIKKVMVLKKLLPHLATRGADSPGDWMCDEARREQTLVHPAVMCQQRLSYCTWELNIMPAPRLFTQPFIQTQIKENIKAPRHWPLCGEFTGDRWIPRTNGQLRGKCFHLMTSSCNAVICWGPLEHILLAAENQSWSPHPLFY